MPTLVCQDCTSAHVLRRYPGQNNRSPFFTPPKQINAASLVDGDDMTPLDHLSPAGATLAQIRYAQEHLVGKEDEGKNSKDYCTGFEDNNFEDKDDSKDGDFTISEAGAGNNLVKDSTCCGLFEYSDNDYNHLDDDDFNEEEMRIENGDIKKRVKTGRRRGNLIVGGPVELKYDIMLVAEAHEAQIQYLSDRKKFRYDKRRERIRDSMGSSFDEADYTGDLTAPLRPMTQVNVSRLKLGQTFPERGLIVLRIAEEANHRGIYCRTDKSDNMKLHCRDEDSFLVNATNSDRGWTITRCQVLEKEGEQRVLGSPTVLPVLSTKTPCSPYKASYIVLLIEKTIAETPMASNKVLRQILEPYGKPYCFTEAIIQGARTEARKLIFGNADENVCYTKFVKEDLEKAGHHDSLSFTTRKETMQNLDKIIIAEEAQRRKDSNIAGILPGQRKDFVLQWKTEHQSQLFA
jgi:hypothetical protein